ncbi:MAG: hypothetical protein HUU57_13735, partial [Bdellovibrio sp.]|nr:hypothetical protein [Bdellovibrio sp.]
MRNLFGTFCGYRVFLLMLILPSLSWGGAAITYHGRILDTQKRPLENPSVLFKIRVYSPNPEKCLLYEEVRTIDMTNSGGVFVVPIGDGQGTRTTADPGLQMEKVFANNPNVTLDNVNTPKLVCNSGSSFTPSLLSQRHLSVSFDDNSGVGEQILPLMDINFVPLAVNAYDSQNLGGTSANSYLRLSSGTATPLSPANFTELLNILNGSSNQYEKPGKLAGQNLPTLANGQVLGWNSGWVAVTPMTSYTETDPSVKAFAKSDLPTCNAGEFLAPNGSGGFACAAVSGASGGTVTSVTAGAGLKNLTSPGDPIINTGTLAVDVGTGANQIVQMGADAKLPAVDGSKLTNVVASGLSSTASINTSGNITTSGSLSVGQITANGNVQTTGDMTTRRLFFYDHSGVGPDSIGLQAPSDIAGAGGASYVLTLPEKKGATGQVLAAKDNSGTLEWISPSAGSVTSVTADAPLASSGGAIPNLSLPKAATGQDGYLAKEDWNTFNAKQNAGNYVTTLSGEVTSSGFAAGTVTTTISNNAVTANKIADGAVGSLSKVVASPGSAGTNRLLATDSTTGTTIKDFYCSTVGHVLKWT